MMKRIQEWAQSVFAEVDEQLETKPLRRPYGALALIEVISFVLGLCFMIPCVKGGGIFWSGVDYSGHGFWGWLALYCTCVFLAGIISMLVLWMLGCATQKKPRLAYLIAGTAFLALSVLGVSRHTPLPIIAELGVTVAAWYGFYLGLFAKEKDKEVDNNR